MHPKAPDRRNPADHVRRDQIIAVANDHFRQYGYEKTTVGDLARAIGFSTAYIYKFFYSKQAIGDAICGICLDKIAADLQSIAAQTTQASERMRQIFLKLSHHARTLSLNECRLQEMVLAACREHWPAFEKHKMALRAVIRRVVEDGRRSGEFARTIPVEETCQGVLLVLEPFWNPILWATRLDHLEAHAATLAALVLRSMAPQNVYE